MSEVTKGHYLAFLGCSRTLLGGRVQRFVLLTLHEADIPTELKRGSGQPAVYHCSWPSGVRSLALPLQLISGLKLKQKDIYLSLRPPYREGASRHHTMIARLMSSSSERPFQLKVPALTIWERESYIKLVDVKMPPLPWNGSTPVVLLFSVQNRWQTWLTLVLGRCTRQEPGHDRRPRDVGGASSSGGALPHHPPLGSHYAVICYDEGGRPRVQSLTPEHSCQDDHLDFAGREHEKKFRGRTNWGSRTSSTVLFRWTSFGSTSAALEVDFKSGLEEI